MNFADYMNKQLSCRTKSGSLISPDECAVLLSIDDYKYIGVNHIGPLRVSTVWLGIPHCGPEGFDYYFETMIFKDESFDSMECYRYRTLADAMEGHEKIVKELVDER